MHYKCTVQLTDGRLAKAVKAWDNKTLKAVDVNDEATSLRQFAFVIDIAYNTLKKFVCEDLESSVAAIPCWLNVIITGGG
jgi:hypothetical protein